VKEFQIPGVLRLELADGWTVTGGELPTLEIVPEEPVGALHLTVLRSKAQTVDANSEARRLVERFVRDRGLIMPQPLSDFDGPGQYAVSCKPDSPGGTAWDVVAIVGHERAVVETYAHGNTSDKRRREALHIIGSTRLGTTGRDGP
jgi:hypothetical protein